METTTLFYIILIGLCVGSFLSVCVYRVQRKLSIITPMRSYCTMCEDKRPLSWWENIPLLSYLLLAGKCRCRKYPISMRYPLLEILSAVFAYQTYLLTGPTSTSLIIYVTACALIVISFIDLDIKIIPNVISYPGMTLGLILGIVSEYTSILAPPLTSGVLDSLFGFVIGGGIFFFIDQAYLMIRGVHGIGMGDVKLMAMVGAIFGLESVFTAIFAGSVVGAIVGIGVIVFTRSGAKAEIPFGPWLAIGAVVHIYTDYRPFPIAELQLLLLG